MNFVPAVADYFCLALPCSIYATWCPPIAEPCTFFLPKMVEPLFKAGDYGGNVTISLLEVDITAEHHGSMFVCEAKNEALGQSVHNAMTISVNCE